MSGNDKYLRTIKQTKEAPGLMGELGMVIAIDVYDVLNTFNVTDPAVAHAVKKLLCLGIRGHKDEIQDLEEVIQAVERAIDTARCRPVQAILNRPA